MDIEFLSLILRLVEVTSYAVIAYSVAKYVKHKTRGKR